MVYTIKYHLRLGDIIRCFPAAKHLTDLGHTVFIECNQEYHEIFKCVNYVRPVPPGQATSKMLDLQIWPDKYQAYRESKKCWYDFVYGLYPEIAGASRDIVLDTIFPYPIVETYNLVAPFGISQTAKVDANKVIQIAETKFGKDNLIILCPEGKQVPCKTCITVSSISLLPGLIRGAKDFMCINSSPAIIASAVRKSWYHIPDTAFNFQDDFEATGRVLVQV